jgi:hypothetical protein
MANYIGRRKFLATPGGAAHEYLAIWIVIRGSGSDVSDARGLVGLLRAPRERPHGCRAAERG